MDILHTDGNRYFTFDPVLFSHQDLDYVKGNISSDGRRLVVITDPHIKVDENYHVYKKGLDLESEFNFS